MDLVVELEGLQGTVDVITVYTLSKSCYTLFECV